MLAGCSSNGSDGATPSGGTSDLDQEYGDPYADGVLPVGDGQYSLVDPAPGVVYLCREGGPNAGGASTMGPWFSADGTTYDIDEKVSVRGEVTWEGAIDVGVSGDTRTITTNDLPVDHTTGEFPVAGDDPAFLYDRNPNTISEQSLTYTFPASPTVAADPACMGGQAGVMLTGVQLFDAFDALLRDAGAWEVQDGCGGHPEITGAYHYHSLSSCIADVGVRTVIGFALDGFPITGPKVSDGNILTTDDLDECHGITSEVVLDGDEVTTYHYVMTQDFPYSVSCFRAEPTQPR